jgi:hypothetical protein
MQMIYNSKWLGSSFQDKTEHDLTPSLTAASDTFTACSLRSLPLKCEQDAHVAVTQHAVHTLRLLTETGQGAPDFVFY